MKRREFIAELGGVAAWPIAAAAQQRERMRRIGVLMSLGENDRIGQRRIAAFRDGLQKLGWVDGRNISIDFRWASDDAARVRSHAAESISLAPEVIFTQGTEGSAVLRHDNRNMPAAGKCREWHIADTAPVARSFSALRCRFLRPGADHEAA